AVTNAINEVTALALKRFTELKRRYYEISDSQSKLEFCKSFRGLHEIVETIDSLVVDLNSCVKAEIVIDEHLFAAHQSHQPYLSRIQPSEMQVGTDAVRIFEGCEDYVLHPAVEIRKSAGGHASRFLAEPVIQDRDVVRSETPQGVDVVLNPAEIYT